MYLKNLKLWNFRKFGSSEKIDLAKPNLNLDFTEGVNVLVGKNDSGKSAIIDAIKIVLKTHSYDWYKIDQDDFFLNTEHLRIEIVFENLQIEEAKHFTEWLGWIEDADGKKRCYLRLMLDVRRNIVSNRIFPADVKAGIDPVGFQLMQKQKITSKQHISDHCEMRNLNWCLEKILDLLKFFKYTKLLRIRI